MLYTALIPISASFSVFHACSTVGVFGFSMSSKSSLQLKVIEMNSVMSRYIFKFFMMVDVGSEIKLNTDQECLRIRIANFIVASPPDFRRRKIRIKALVLSKSQQVLSCHINAGVV